MHGPPSYATTLIGCTATATSFNYPIPPTTLKHGFTFAANNPTFWRAYVHHTALQHPTRPDPHDDIHSHLSTNPLSAPCLAYRSANSLNPTYMTTTSHLIQVASIPPTTRRTAPYIAAYAAAPTRTTTASPTRRFRTWMACPTIVLHCSFYLLLLQHSPARTRPCGQAPLMRATLHGGTSAHRSTTTLKCATYAAAPARAHNAKTNSTPTPTMQCV